MRAMAPPEITLPDIYRSVVPFVAIMLPTLVIIAILPRSRRRALNYVYSNQLNRRPRMTGETTNEAEQQARVPEESWRQ